MKNKQELYSVSELLNFMGTYGLPSSRMWLRRAEANGKLVTPRMPNSRRDRAFTMEQMAEIVEAFLPGGKGEWKYE